VEKQVLAIFAGNRGYLDEIEVDRVQDYERMLYEHFDRNHPDLIKTLAEKQEIDAELDEAISRALTEFNQIFKQETEPAAEDKDGDEIKCRP